MPVVNATVPNTISGGFQILQSAPFMASLSMINTKKFVLELQDILNLNLGGTSPLEIDDTEFTVQLVDCNGYNVRADRVLRCIQERAAMRGILNLSDVPPCLTGFCGVLASDPNRIIILDCLPRSTYVGSIASSADPIAPAPAEPATAAKAAK